MLGGLACWRAATAPDVPLVDEVVVLDEADPEGVRARVCRRRGGRRAGVFGGRPVPRLRDAACSMARNLSVAAAMSAAVGARESAERPRCSWEVVPPPSVASTASSDATVAPSMQAITRRR